MKSIKPVKKVSSDKLVDPVTQTIKKTKEQTITKVIHHPENPPDTLKLPKYEEVALVLQGGAPSEMINQSLNRGTFNLFNYSFFIKIN